MAALLPLSICTVTAVILNNKGTKTAFHVEKQRVISIVRERLDPQENSQSFDATIALHFYVASPPLSLLSLLTVCPFV